MTAPSFRFFNTPEYQQKLSKLSREERNVLGSLLADEDESDKAMKEQLALMELGTREKLTNRSLALEEKRQTDTLGLKREELGQRERLSRDSMSAREAITNRRLAVESGIAQGQWDFERGQMPWATGIGIANVAAGGLTGYASMMKDEQTAEALKKLVGFYG